MLFAVVALICVISVPLLGGRLGLLGDVRFRGVGVAVAGLAIQIVIISILPQGDDWRHTAAHLVSYVLVGWVVYANREIAFMLMIGMGGLLNFIAIVANGGVMPAHPEARRIAGMPQAGDEFVNSGVLADPNLLFLGDVFPLPAPWSPNVFSPGDVVMALGALLCLHTICHSRLVGARGFRATSAPAHR